VDRAGKTRELSSHLWPPFQEIESASAAAGNAGYIQMYSSAMAPSRHFATVTIRLPLSSSPMTHVHSPEVEANASRQLAVHLKQEIQRIISLSKLYDPAA
jgi:hypothetical protein